MAWDIVEVIADGAIATRPCFCGGATLIGGLDAASLELFDGDPAGTGTLKETLEAAAAGVDTRDFGDGVGFPNGLYILITGNGAVGYIRWK